MKHTIKYLHIMTHPNSTHNGSIINMINDSSLSFEPSEHIFVMARKSSYEDFKHYNNVLLNEYIVDSNMKEFNKWANKSKYIFLHRNNLTFFQLLKINERSLNKIIWCFWGESQVYPFTSKTDSMTKKVQKVGSSLLRNLSTIRINKFHAIGIGFEYDAIAIKKRFGSIKILATPYGYEKGNKEKYLKTLNKNAIKEKKLPKKIMIGHSAYSHLRHMEILDELYKFKMENIMISLVLSYGDKKYAEKVEEYALRKFPNKVEIIRDYMTSEEYLQYLNTIDVWILDYTGQNALGNFYTMLFFNKKIFLNNDGILMLASRLEGLDVFNVRDINDLNYDQFIEPSQIYKNNERFASFYIDEMNIVTKWKKTLEGLK